MKVLSWLVVEEVTSAKPVFFVPAAAGGPPVVKK
jgi:hypothetical protein